MIFLIGVILIAIAMLLALTIGSRQWEQDNTADLFGRLFFWAGIATVGLSCVIALAKVMP